MAPINSLLTNGPRRLLALDGGGIRGLISLEFLARIEALLRQRFESDELVLADYFHYIAGTSTGAIIASALAMGWSVGRVQTLYRNNGKAMFKKARWWERLWYKYRRDQLETMLKTTFGAGTTLGSTSLRTLLMVVMRNATTDSPWPLSNNSNGKYNDRRLSECNLNIPLWQLVRASTAAPTYFPPEVVALGEKRFVFVDGGTTTYNNPAFLLFLMATTKPYRLEWPVGEKQMLLVSIGTGTAPDADGTLAPSQMNILYSAKAVPAGLMYAAVNEQDLLCRIFGRCRYGRVIDDEVGDLMELGNPEFQTLFTYLRYDVDLSVSGLRALGIEDVQPTEVQALDSVRHMDDLIRVGSAAARHAVRPEHFKDFG